MVAELSAGRVRGLGHTLGDPGTEDTERFLFVGRYRQTKILCPKTLVTSDRKTRPEAVKPEFERNEFSPKTPRKSKQLARNFTHIG